MYMNRKPNKHKITSFNTTIMASLGFIAPPAPLNFSNPPFSQNLIFCLALNF